ncbi:MAG: hypothetical protein IKZ41_07735 [Clostridia bacterium]|nr:hypothetical protein [Clostridia bacterium]
MKKTVLLLLVLLVLLPSCSKEPPSQTISISPHDRQEETETPTEAIDRASETLPFLASSEAYYSDGTLYSTGGNLLLYTPLETGEARPLCFDPLCQHEYAGACTARVNHPKSRMIVKDGMCWFTAMTATKTIGDVSVCQLHAMDVASGKVRVLYEQEQDILEFWLLGDTVYLSSTTAETNTEPDGNSRIEITGYPVLRLDKYGSTTTVINDPDGMQPVLVGSDGGAVYYRSKVSGGSLYAADYGFQKSIPVFEPETGSWNLTFFDGWLYYIRRTDRTAVPENDEEIEGEFDEELSFTSGGTARICELVRRGTDGEEEILCEAVPTPKYNAGEETRLFRIDRDAGILYYVPLDLSYRGSVVWELSAEEKAFHAQFGELHDKPILTKQYSQSGGRLTALDLVTMESRDVLSDCGADIVDLYAVEDGRVWARFELYDVEEIKAKMAAGVKSDSMLTYAYTGSEDILP